MKINQIINEGLVFYAKNPDGTKTYSLVKDAEHLANLEQKYRGAQVQKLDFARQDVQDWLDSRGVNLRRFPPGMETTVGPNQGRPADAPTKPQNVVWRAPGYKPGKGSPFDTSGSTLVKRTNFPAKDDVMAEGFFGIDDKIKGKIQNIVSDLSDIPGMWDHKAQTFTDAGMDKLKTVLKNNPKYIKYALNLDYRDYEAESVAKGDPQLQPGMQVKDGTIVKVNGNTVTIKTSNGDLMNMNIHDVDVAQNMAEGKKKSEPPEADYGADYQDMVSRVKKLAGLGPLKTVYDPQKRVYKNVPKAEQPKK
jgi:hypothetical protein